MDAIFVSALQDLFMFYEKYMCPITNSASWIKKNEVDGTTLKKIMARWVTEEATHG